MNGHGELAENLFHDFTGWLVFMIAGAILFGVTLILKRIGRPSTIVPTYGAGRHTPVESTFSGVAERHSTGQAQTHADIGPSADGRGKMDGGRWGKAARTKTVIAPNDPSVLNDQNLLNHLNEPNGLKLPAEQNPGT